VGGLGHRGITRRNLPGVSGAVTACYENVSFTTGRARRTVERERIFAIRGAGHVSIAQVLLPSGDATWVRVQAADREIAADAESGPVDVGLHDHVALTIEALRLPGFAETVRGVVESVRQALDDHRPDSLAVEFGIEIAARTGGLVSVLADVGGSAQIKMTATWNRRAAESSPRSAEVPS
jgi:hypothetical protein